MREAVMHAALFLLVLPAAPKELPKEPALQAVLNLPPRQAAGGDDALKKLLVARYNSAVAELKGRAEDYVKEMAPLPAVFHSAAVVCRAEADLAEKPGDRVAALERLAGVRRLAETTLEKWLEEGRITRGPVLEARYERLSAEIDVERAKRQPR
jgi:hypothetical protein